MALTIRPIMRGEIEPARQLLLANGWSGRRFDPEPFTQMIERTPLSLVAVAGDVVVGFARAITDGVSNGYLCTLVVAESHRRRGVARTLVAAAMGDDPDMTWVLRAARPELQPFYEKLGFRRSQVTMERLRSVR